MSTDANENISKLDLLTQAAEIVAAYVSNNAISAADVPELLTTVHNKLGELAVEGDEAQGPLDPLLIFLANERPRRKPAL